MKKMKPGLEISDRKGTMSFYGLIILLILSYYVSGLQFSSLDQNMVNKFELFEAHARQGADAGLEICLRVAGGSSVDATLVLAINSGSVGSMAIIYSTDTAEPCLGSVTAVVYDRNNQEVARKTARNKFSRVNRRFEEEQWSR